jgi:hypothetical protein
MADSLGLTFTAPAAAAGQAEAELVPGGAELAVTAGNAQQYVDVLLDHKLMGGCEQQVRRRVSGWQHTARQRPWRGRRNLPLMCTVPMSADLKRMLAA